MLGRVSGTVRSNVVQGALGAPEAAPGFIYGVVVAPSGCACVGTDDNGAIVIRGNLIRRLWYGVMLIGAQDVLVRGNEVRRVLGAMMLQDTRASRIANNEFRGAEAGVWVTGTSRANHLIGNVVAGAGGSCIDDTTGGRTAGTANTWIGNTAHHGSSPSAICAPS
jgi:nitrous oxidase accessory protein NosD